MATKLRPVHPGEILLEEFLEPMGLSQNQVALALRVPARRINEIVRGKRAVTADTALRLGRFFGMSAQFWINLQACYDLDVAEDALGDRLEREVQVMETLRSQHRGARCVEGEGEAAVLPVNALLPQNFLKAILYDCALNNRVSARHESQPPAPADALCGRGTGSGHPGRDGLRARLAGSAHPLAAAEPGAGSQAAG